MKPRLKLERDERLRQSRQFQEIYIGGRRLSGPHLTIFYKPNRLAYTRLGLSVSKKRFKLSSWRHYIRRRIREAYRVGKMHFLPGYDIVVAARGFNKHKTRFKDLKNELFSLAQKARLLKANVK